MADLSMKKVGELQNPLQLLRSETKSEEKKHSP